MNTRLVILTSIVIGTSMLCGCIGQPSAYNVQKARYDGISENVEVSGDIKGEKSTTYYSNVTAPVSMYDLKVGDSVQANQQVVAYDTEDLVKAYDQAVLTAQSSENSMNGQIAESNKKAQIYNQAVSDVNTYMQLYAVVRASNDQVDQGQYQENWDISSVGQAIQLAIDAKNKEIAEKNLQAAQYKEVLQAKDNSLTTLPYDIDDYDDISRYMKYEIGVTQSDLAAINSEISQLNIELASLKADYDALPPQSLTPEEYAREVVNGNWMSDIMRNWTQATTLQNTYQTQILNSYQKDQLQNNYDLSELNVTNAQDNINKANKGVAAEFNGIVTESYVNCGSVVTKGSPLFTIESSDNLKVEVGISKYDIAKIKLGQRAVVSIAGRDYEGLVSQIKRLATVTDSDKAKVEVDIHIDNPDENVYLGLEADVTIFTNEKDKTLIIPIDGYYVDDKGGYCYVIKDGVIEKRYIIIGIEADDYVEVLDGIAVGDEVITDAITDDAVGKKAEAK